MGVTAATVDLMVGKILHVGKRPGVGLAVRLNAHWNAALGFDPSDFERPEGAPADWRPVPSSPPDDQLFTALGLLVIARTLPSLFPGAESIRETSAIRILEVHDLVMEVLVDQGLNFGEIAKLSNEGIGLLRAAQDKVAAMEGARKEARGNSEAPTGPSSTGPG